MTAVFSSLSIPLLYPLVTFSYFVVLLLCHQPV
jgi:hypothetical protein